LCRLGVHIFVHTVFCKTMTPDERERMNLLCDQIAKEIDHNKFVKLVQELNDLLDNKEQRLEESPEKP
jgi:hypothetical protein